MWIEISIQKKISERKPNLTMSLQKANSLAKIYSAFKMGPLKIEELDEFYCKTIKARGENPRRRFARTLRNNTGTDQHMLFVGYRGCGKSTELNHLQKDISDDFLILNFSIQEELDPVNINYIELFIVTMERLFSVVEEHDIDVSKKYIKSITHWLKSTEIEEIREKYNIGAELEAGVDVNVGIPYLQKFFAKFKMTAKSSRSLKETLKTNVEPRLSDLIEHCNTLITEIRLDLKKTGKKDILIIIEDLDKIPLDRAEHLFFNHISQLVQIKTNVIYTFPIALYYHLQFNTIKPNFTDCYELPMIKVRQKDGSINTEGVNTMIKIVKSRMDINLFENPTFLNEMIDNSGGCLRDLFLMVVESAENAQDFDRETITKEDCKRAFQKLKKEYENNIADYVKDNEVIIPVEDYYKVLIKLATDTTKKVDNTQAVMHLRQNLSVLGYNGEQWYDVHPIVKAILKERNKID